MVVDKRTVLNEDRERVHVRWTAKRRNEIDLIGQLNVAWLLGHSRGSSRRIANEARLSFQYTKSVVTVLTLHYLQYHIRFASFNNKNMNRNIFKYINLREKS